MHPALLGESKQVRSESFSRKFKSKKKPPVGETMQVPAISKAVGTIGSTLFLLNSLVLISLHQILKWGWIHL